MSVVEFVRDFVARNTFVTGNPDKDCETSKGGPSERQHLLVLGREDSECGRRTTKNVLPEDIEIRSSLQPIF